MQVLTWNSGDNENIAIYQFSDDTIIEIGNDRTVLKYASGDEQLIISDVNTSNIFCFLSIITSSYLIIDKRLLSF